MGERYEGAEPPCPQKKNLTLILKVLILTFIFLEK
jgi:hypothetical protein